MKQCKEYNALLFKVYRPGKIKEKLFKKIIFLKVDQHPVYHMPAWTEKIKHVLSLRFSQTTTYLEGAWTAQIGYL